MTSIEERLASVEGEAKYAHKRLDGINGQIVELRVAVESHRADLSEQAAAMRAELHAVREIVAGLAAKSKLYATVAVVVAGAAVGSFVTLVVRAVAGG